MSFQSTLSWNDSVFISIKKVRSISNILGLFSRSLLWLIMYITHVSFRALWSAFKCILHKWCNVMQHMKSEIGSFKLLVKRALKWYMVCLYSLAPWVWLSINLECPFLSAKNVCFVSNVYLMYHRNLIFYLYFIPGESIFALIMIK